MLLLLSFEYKKNIEEEEKEEEERITKNEKIN
jgi:hypothetical protein